MIVHMGQVLSNKMDSRANQLQTDQITDQWSKMLRTREFLSIKRGLEGERLSKQSLSWRATSRFLGEAQV